MAIARASGDVRMPVSRVSSVVERILGKAEVESSSLSRGTTKALVPKGLGPSPFPGIAAGNDVSKPNMAMRAI